MFLQNRAGLSNTSSDSTATDTTKDKPTGDTTTPDGYQAWVQSGGQESVLRDVATILTSDPMAKTLRSGQEKVIGVGPGISPFGHDYAPDILKDPSYAQQFVKQPRETADQWINRLSLTFGPGVRYAWDKYRLTQNPNAEKFLNYDAGANGQPSQLETDNKKVIGETQKTQDQIKKFADGLLSPLDPNDPRVQRISQLAASRGSDQARLQGVQGPMSVANSEQSTNNALAGYDQDRQSLGFEALKYKNASQIQQGQIQDDRNRRDWEDRMGLAQLNNQNNPTSRIFGVAGGALGGVFGGIFGGPAGATAGGSGGYALGTGLGNVVQGNGSYPAPPRRGGGYGGGYGGQ